jgi:hypothetical protein
VAAGYPPRVGELTYDDHLHRTRRPWQNPWVESFNSRMRDEFLEINDFATPLEARVIIGDWRPRLQPRPAAPPGALLRRPLPPGRLARAHYCAAGPSESVVRANGSSKPWRCHWAGSGVIGVVPLSSG